MWKLQKNSYIYCTCIALFNFIYLEALLRLFANYCCYVSEHSRKPEEVFKLDLGKEIGNVSRKEWLSFLYKT